MRSHVPTLAPELDGFVLRLLEKDPARRYPDMTAVIRELSKWEKTDTVLRMKQVRVIEQPTQIPSPFQPSTK
jgi:hypothetical protein